MLRWHPSGSAATTHSGLELLCAAVDGLRSTKQQRWVAYVQAYKLRPQEVRQSLGAGGLEAIHAHTILGSRDCIIFGMSATSLCEL